MMSFYFVVYWIYMKLLLVGLGNPGVKYQHTRHNIGWIILEQMFPQVSWELQKYAQALFTKENIADCKYIVIKPQTFMNESGISVKWFLDEYKDSSIFVLYDDLDLPVGTWKLSHDRGSGGHNGIKSIEKHLGTRDFFRIRIGIARELENGSIVKPNVLGNFESNEQEKILALLPEIKNMLQIYREQGKDKAMTFANTKKQS